MSWTVWVAAIFTGTIVALYLVYAVMRYGDGSPSNLDAIAQTGLLTATAIAAFWTVWLTLQNNMTAWLAYEESIRPSVLFRIVQDQPQNGQPVSRILYQNSSRHDAEKLRVSLKVSAGADEADLSDLFVRDFILPAGDDRNRKLLPHTDPLARGFDLQAKAAAGEEIKLSIGYSFMHGGKRVTVPVHQTYKWNSALQMWEIDY